MKKVALINDLSGFGKCSLTAAIPVISIMGLQACPLPTAVLSAQTGFPSFYCDDFTDKMDFFTTEWQKLDVHFDGIHSGYLASPAQIEKVISFLDCFQKQNTIYLADPVMGDNGKTFKAFTPQLLSGMKRLVTRANVITPNLTELCLLADFDYSDLVRHADKSDYLERIAAICHTLLKNTSAKQTIVVTGIISHSKGNSYMGNLSVNADTTFYTETPYTGMGFSGTGDLFAAVVCGGLVNQLPLESTIRLAVDFLQPAIEEASREQVPANHGIHFEKYLGKLMQI